MVDRLFNAPAMTVLEKALGASRLTHDVIANNLANLETPGFKRSEVLFQQQLAAALNAAQDEPNRLKGARTDPRHFAIGEGPSVDAVQPQVVVRAETTLRPDGNNVDLDAEMVKLNQNELLYESLEQLVRNRIAQLRSVIREGR